MSDAPEKLDELVEEACATPSVDRASLRCAAHVWLVDAAAVTDPRLHETYRDLLSAEERARHDRFRVSHARLEFLLGRALVRTVLSRYAAVAPTAWVFRANEHGRPEIAGPEGAASAAGLRFNLSHTRGLVACVVTEGVEAGVDVELVGRVRHPLKLSQHYFAAAESAALRGVEGEARQELFGAFWTLKEAYIKARGRGISLGLGRFAFTVPGDGRLAVRFSPQLGDRETDWQFALYRPTERHFLAVALRRGPAGDLPIHARAIVPLTGRLERRDLPRVAATRPPRSP